MQSHDAAARTEIRRLLVRFRFDEPRQKHAVAGKSVQFDVLNDFQPAFQ